MATYYKDLWDYTAKLCRLPAWTYNPSTFVFSANEDHAETIRQGFNECIQKIAMNKYAPKIEDEIHVFSGDTYYIDYKDFIYKPHNIINVKTDVMENGNKLNWKYSRDFGERDVQIRLDDEYHNGDILYIDYYYIPNEVSLIYDSLSTKLFPFSSSVVDWRMICYYAASNWYLVEGGEEDIKMSILYSNKFQEMFDKIKNPLNNATKTFQRGSMW